MLRPTLHLKVVVRNLWSATSELNPASINLYAGMRASLALSLPAVLGLLAKSSTGSAASLGAFETSLADTGGPYSTRAEMTVTAAVAGSILFALGSISALNPPIVLCLTGIIAFCTAYLAAFGTNGRILGNVLLTLFLAGIGTKYAGLFGLKQATPCLAGGLWAVLLSLAMWPISPYGPARSALGSCYRDFSRWLKDCQYLLSTGPASSGKWEGLARSHKQRIEGIVDYASQFVLETRYVRGPGARRGDQILVLLRISDSLLDQIVALNYHLDSLCRAGLSTDVGFEIGCVIANMQEVLLYIAEQSSGSRRTAVPRRTLQMAEGSLIAIEEIIARNEGLNSTDLHTVIKLCRSSLTEIRVAAITAYGIETGEPEDLQLLREKRKRLPEMARTLEQHWSRDSLILRHALRAGIVCFVALTLSFLLGLNRGYWAPLTAAIILQPHSGLTMRRSVQRLAGTLAGALIAVFISLTVPTRALMVALLVPLTLITAAIRQASYPLFVLFLTPVFLLLAEAHPGDWHLAQVRAIDTALGCVVAVAGAWLLWPAWETPRFANAFARALRANANFLRQTMKMAVTPEQSRIRGLSAIRKAAAIANANAESSLENLLQESNDEQLVMPAMELVSALRRFSYRVNAIAPLAALQDFSSDISVAQLEKLCDRIDSLAVILSEGAGPNSENLPIEGLADGSPQACELHDKCVLNDQLPALEQFTEMMSNAVMDLSRYHQMLKER